MIKNQKRKKQKQQLLLGMIVAGMKRSAMTLAVAGFAAAERTDRLVIR
jgi:hypothetical protein